MAKKMNELDIKKKYFEDGYVIFKNLIPKIKIDNLIKYLEIFKHSKSLYYSQSIHSWITPNIDKNGFMIESMENFTRIFWLRKLAKYGNEILLGAELETALKKINPDINLYVQWQNMLFDKSTGTIDHYDSYYLDTLPSGNLIGAWVALEDINKNSGPFKLYPGSHNYFLDGKWNKLSHNDFRIECKKYSEKHKSKDALLFKGDVLLWHPSLMHGASLQKDSAYSRKSLTSHYYPYGHGKKFDEERKSFIGDLKEKIFFYRPHKIKKYPILSNNQPITDIMFSLKGLMKYYNGKFFGKIDKGEDMKRASY